MSGITFALEARSSHSRARAGRLVTHHGVIETPAFVPVGSQATVKSLTPDDLIALRAQAVLVNVYHVSLRPGVELIAQLGGLHHFMGWEGPIVTDSGGFQVFSLGFGREQGVGKIALAFPGDAPVEETSPHARLVAIDAEGVTFTSHWDGSTQWVTPERSIALQQSLGADIMMAFDECTSPLASYEYTKLALARTNRWALTCLEAWTSPNQALFGIVQGGAYRDLREESAQFIAAQQFSGYAIGGSLGRSKEDMRLIIEWVMPNLPDEKPRHLLGIGEPLDMLDAVARGIDLFDCAMPTRIARHGVLYTSHGRFNITKPQFREDKEPIEEGCGCFTCQRFSRAYLRHLFVAEELLAYRLATIHNLTFITQFIARTRQSILEDRFEEYAEAFRKAYQTS